jgi:hypothetical protein
MGTLPIAFTETSYQTEPLEEYSPGLRERAAALFRLVEARARGRARIHKGSFSVLASSSEATAAKIVVYEAGKGKVNGPDPQLADGIYVLIRVSADGVGRTLGVAPNHHERFAYFRLAPEQDLESMAGFIAAYAAAR